MADCFDRLPDCLINLIFNSVSDLKTLTRCRSVSKRFNSLVSQTDSLLLKVDFVISSDRSSDGTSADDPLLVAFFKFIVKSFFDLFSPKAVFLSPRILRGFDRIRELEIELPSGELKLEKGSVVRWKAEFGHTLKSCVILGFQSIRDSPAPGETDDGSGDVGFAERLKTRVLWTISALMAASARHYLMKEVVRERREIERLIMRDREEEGTVVMERRELRECRESETAVDEEERSRMRVPSVRMKMKHAPRLALSGGVWVEGGTLVVVRPTNGPNEGGTHSRKADVDERETEAEDVDLALGAFQGLYSEAAEALLRQGQIYLLEMNSF